MKNKILLLFFFLTSLSVFSNDFKFYELDADLLKRFKVDNSNYLIETRNQSCLLFDIENESFEEIYTGINEVNQSSSQIRIESTVLMGDYLFISTPNSNRFIDMKNNAILVDSTSKIVISYSFLNKENELIGVSKDGNIYSIELKNNIYYNVIGNIDSPIANLKVDDENYLITTDGGLYNTVDINSKIKSVNIYQTPSQINQTDEYIIFEYPYYFKKYSKNFEFIDSINTGSFYYSVKNDGYIVPQYAIDTMKVYEFNNDKVLINTSTYALPSKLRVLNVIAQILYGDKLYLFSDKKYICKYNIKAKSFEEISILSLTQSPIRGGANFYNNEIGGFCSNSGSLYLTDNGGTTWKRFYEFNMDQDPNNFFSEIRFLSSTDFLAFGDAYKGTIKSEDFGKSYVNYIQPSGMADNITSFEKLKSGSYLQTYTYSSQSGIVQAFRKYDKEFNKLKDTYLLNYAFMYAARVNNKIKSISQIPKEYPEPTTYFIIETDTNFSQLKIDTISSDFSFPSGIVSFKEKFYFLLANKNIDGQFLLSSSEEDKEWDTVLKTKDTWYYGIYSQNDKLYILDSNYVLFELNIENNELEFVAQLPKIPGRIKSITIFDNEIYVSLGTSFYKGIRIPEFSPQTSVEVVPTFFTYSPYPLPTKDFVNIKLDYDQRFDRNKLELKLYNANGALLSDKLDYTNSSLSAYKLNLNVNLSSYQHGIYFIKLNFGNKTEYVPVIKE